MDTQNINWAFEQAISMTQKLSPKDGILILNLIRSPNFFIELKHPFDQNSNEILKQHKTQMHFGEFLFKPGYKPINNNQTELHVLLRCSHKIEKNKLYVGGLCSKYTMIYLETIKLSIRDFYQINKIPFPIAFVDTESYKNIKKGCFFTLETSISANFIDVDYEKECKRISLFNGTLSESIVDHSISKIKNKKEEDSLIVAKKMFETAFTNEVNNIKDDMCANIKLKYITAFIECVNKKIQDPPRFESFYFDTEMTTMARIISKGFKRIDLLLIHLFISKFIVYNKRLYMKTNLQTEMDCSVLCNMTKFKFIIEIKAPFINIIDHISKTISSLPEVEMIYKEEQIKHIFLMHLPHKIIKVL